MTFQQLRYLLEVHRTGSISKAADNLYVSRPSVSFCINSLEEEIGYPIFQRTRQGLIPSKPGQQFLEYAARICETHKLMGMIGQQSAARSVNLSICSYHPVVEAVSKLMQEYPNRQEVTFSFCVHSMNDIFEKLAQFEVDLAVFPRFASTKTLIETQLKKRGLELRILGSVPTVFCIGPEHRLYHKESISPTDLEHDSILDTASCEVSRNSYIRRIMNIPPECVIPCNEGSIKHELISKGLAYTIGRMPPKELIQRRKLRCIPIEELSQPLFCAWNPARPMAPEVQRFIALLEESIALYTAPD